jgi:hypothetical protein
MMVGAGAPASREGTTRMVIFPGMIVIAMTPWSSRPRPGYVLATDKGTVHLVYCATDVFEHRRNHQVRVVGHGVGSTLICPYKSAKILRSSIVKVIAQLPYGIVQDVARVARTVEIPVTPGRYASVHYEERS